MKNQIRQQSRQITPLLRLLTNPVQRLRTPPAQNRPAQPANALMTREPEHIQHIQDFWGDTLTAAGAQSADGKASFKNFEFTAKVKTYKGANSGIYFHTAYQDGGWPAAGYECQVNATHGDKKKTGGLYAVKDVMDTPAAPDDEWFDYRIRVEGKRVQIWINGKQTVDFTEPADWTPPKGMAGRKLGAGTFALQAHDPGCKVDYKDIKVETLP